MKRASQSNQTQPNKRYSHSTTDIEENRMIFSSSSSYVPSYSTMRNHNYESELKKQKITISSLTDQINKQNKELTEIKQHFKMVIAKLKSHQANEEQKKKNIHQQKNLQMQQLKWLQHLQQLQFVNIKNMQELVNLQNKQKNCTCGNSSKDNDATTCSNTNVEKQ